MIYFLMHTFICKLLNLEKLDINKNTIKKKISKKYCNFKFTTLDEKKYQFSLNKIKSFKNHI